MTNRENIVMIDQFHNLRAAYETDVSPILAECRLRKDTALDPIAAYRATGYRREMAKTRR
jgi:L-rhamnose isomerase/sugar isomerase